MGRECKQKGEELVAVLGILALRWELQAAAAEGGGGGMGWEGGREGAEPWQFEVGEEGGGCYLGARNWVRLAWTVRC